MIDDPGVASTTARLEDLHRFKVPGLRNLSRLAPYFHDNSAATLEDVVDYFNSPTYNDSIDGQRYPISLSSRQRNDLVAFLKEILWAPLRPRGPCPRGRWWQRAVGHSGHLTTATPLAYLGSVSVLTKPAIADLRNDCGASRRGGGIPRRIRRASRRCRSPGPTRLRSRPRAESVQAARMSGSLSAPATRPSSNSPATSREAPPRPRLSGSRGRRPQRRWSTGSNRLVAPARSTLSGNADSPPPSRRWHRKCDIIIGRSNAIKVLLTTLESAGSFGRSRTRKGQAGQVRSSSHARSITRASGPLLRSSPSTAVPFRTRSSRRSSSATSADLTRAVSNRPGAFEAADCGTLFLDQIGEMPLALQVKLLRVLEDRRGDAARMNGQAAHERPTLTTTNRNLEAEVRAGRFREDLFTASACYPRDIPPLRDRPEDIPPLVTHHLGGDGPTRAAPACEHDSRRPGKASLSHRWPGNVRELINALERAVVVAERGVI